jgi:hypothetical protein
MPRDSENTTPASITHSGASDDQRTLNSLFALAPPQVPGRPALNSMTLARRLERARFPPMNTSMHTTQQSSGGTQPPEVNIPYFQPPTVVGRRVSSPTQPTAETSSRGDVHKSASSESIALLLRATITDELTDDSNALSFSVGRPYTDGPTTPSPQPCSENEGVEDNTAGSRSSAADTNAKSEKGRKKYRKRNPEDHEYRHKTYSIKVREEIESVRETPTALTRSRFTSDGTQKPDE